jgi:hypothetical protein
MHVTRKHTCFESETVCLPIPASCLFLFLLRGRVKSCLGTAHQRVHASIHMRTLRHVQLQVYTRACGHVMHECDCMHMCTQACSRVRVRVSAEGAVCMCCHSRPWGGSLGAKRDAPAGGATPMLAYLHCHSTQCRGLSPRARPAHPLAGRRGHLNPPGGTVRTASEGLRR